jgi:hypothetical protein
LSCRNGNKRHEWLARPFLFVANMATGPSPT